MLIDSGGSHNFICSKLVQLAGLETLPTSDFMVKVGNGSKLLVKAIVREWKYNFAAC